MTTLFAAVNQRRATWADIRVPYSGAGSADLVLDEVGAELAGLVTVTLGGFTMRGTVDPEHSGVFAEGRRVRVIGGAGAWGRELPPRPYHNDAGVKVSTVLQGAAAEAGEQLVIGDGVEAKLAADYVREAGPASAVFTGAAPAAVWWVDPAGVTHVAAARPSSELTAGDLELLDFDPLQQTAFLAGDPAAVAIGSVLRFPGRLAAPFVVGELAFLLEEDSLRILADGRGDAPGGRLLDPFIRLARRVRDEKLPGVYRYRVVSTSGDRVKLQAVTKGRWPDILPASLGGGAGGSWADLAGGSIVLVAFEDEDRDRPVVLSAAPRGRPGHVPTVAALNGTEVQLGDHEAAVHRVGDLGAGGTFSAAGGPITYTGEDGKTWALTGVVGPTPVLFTTAPLTSLSPGKLITKATAGSGKVKA